MSHLVAPSLLAADFGHLKREIEMVNNSEADWFHLDIMDGVFVPNISFGFPVIEYVKKYAEKPMDVHLMITQPERYIRDFRAAGADILSVHYEASIHLHRSIYAIKEEGMKAGVVLNPHTSVEVLIDIIEDVDLVLIMSVNPGFGGQKFIYNAFNKVAALRELIDGCGSNALIEIDGGVNTENAGELVETGVDVLVAGNAVFKSDDPMDTIKQLKKV
ncbi:MAG: ribulose-phosphate 3-epimerase [bacterium]|jgi:ribulose-phosphate 3-epimerase